MHEHTCDCIASLFGLCGRGGQSFADAGHVREVETENLTLTFRKRRGAGWNDYSGFGRQQVYVICCVAIDLRLSKDVLDRWFLYVAGSHRRRSLTGGDRAGPASMPAPSCLPSWPVRF